MPCRQTFLVHSGLCPRFGLGPKFFARKARPGAQPQIFLINADGKAEPCLTSGGEAGAKVAQSSSLLWDCWLTFKTVSHMSRRSRGHAVPYNVTSPLS